MSIVKISGILASPNLSVRSTRLYFPVSAFTQVSKEGVAEAKITEPCSIEALITAISRAEYNTPSSCLYDVSCSSSTTINPKFLNGRYKDDLAPTTTCALASATMRQQRLFSVIVTPECHCAGFWPNRFFSLSKNSTVRAISGIRINACLPNNKHSATASK